MITPIYAAIIGLMLIGLSLHVIKGRRLHGAGIGDAGNTNMMRRIRAQANMTEYAPIFIILTAFAETRGLAAWAVHALCLAFLLGRFFHAYSLLNAEEYEQEKLTAKPIWRIRGMMLTFMTIGSAAATVIAQAFASLF